MTRTPLVSILIPAYNKGKWIGETIESALAQTWKNKEIIIVDDGSTDNTLEIARQFEDKTVNVVAQENQGACSARNHAYSLAQGSYIQWLDADDILDSRKIEIQMQGAPDGKTAICLRTAAFGSFYFSKQRAKFTPSGLWQDLRAADWMIKKFQEAAWMNPTAWLVSRSLTEKAGGWDQRLTSSGADDGEYICRLVRNSLLVEFCPQAKCYYRIGNLSSLNHNSHRALESLLLALQACVEHLLALEDSPRARSAAVEYLQHWFAFFYLGSPELLAHIQELAATLGGELIEPTFTWKFKPVRRMLGWKTANDVSKYLRTRRMLTEKAIDRLYSKSGFGI